VQELDDGAAVRIAPQEKIKVVSEANPKRAFRVKVTESRPASG